MQIPVRFWVVALVFALGAMSAGAQQEAKLRVFFVDVEGGQATLFVTPEGESLLIDTGWPGKHGRDADRIVATARAAGLSRIDYVLVTHFHTDHVGGVPQLVARMPVGTLIDHGVNRELDHGITEHGYAEYEKVLAAGKVQHLTMHAGDRLPLRGMEVTVVSGDGEVLAAPIENAVGAGEENAACATSAMRPLDVTENARSLGVVVRYGALRLVDLGDLTWDKERGLVCPVNKLGRADVLIVSHHGWDHSSSPALVDAVHARVAVMDNGAKKGGSPLTFKTLKAAPGLEDLWQVHYSEEGGTQWNRAEAFVANPAGKDLAKGLELVGDRDGGFVVKNERTGVEKAYVAR